MVNDTVIRNFFYTSTPEHEGVLFHIPSGRFFRVFDEKCKSDFRQIFEIGSLSEDVLEMLHKIDSGKGVCSGSCENCDNQIKSANEFTVRKLALAVFLLVILIVYRRISQYKFCRCKQCKSTIGQNDSFCKKCGIELTADNKEIIIKKANRRISVGIYALLGIIIISGVTGVFLYSRNGSLLYDLSGSTGVYAQKYDNTISDADYWIVDCKALSDGVFKKSVRNEKLENLIVEGRTTDGEMILTVEAGNCKKEYNITNTEGEMVFDVSEFEPGLLKLYISHPKSEHIFVCIKWK